MLLCHGKSTEALLIHRILSGRGCSHLQWHHGQSQETLFVIQNYLIQKWMQPHEVAPWPEPGNFVCQSELPDPKVDAATWSGTMARACKLWWEPLVNHPILWSRKRVGDREGSFAALVPGVMFMFMHPSQWCPFPIHLHLVFLKTLSIHCFLPKSFVIWSLFMKNFVLHMLSLKFKLQISSLLC